MTFFRYPGGKSKIRKRLCEKLNLISPPSTFEYREPFFGGGSVGINFLSTVTKKPDLWLNDKDPGISSLWSAVINYPEELKERVCRFQPSIEHYNSFKNTLIENNAKTDSKESIVENGFQKLAVHQTSYSGLGTKSGGPLGGKLQKSKYKIDCRWSPKYLCKKIDKLSNAFSSVKIRENGCTNYDFEKLISEPGSAVLYLDPPYFEKGGSLYQFSFEESDHERFANLLKNTDHPFVLSYDDCDAIRDLYGWAQIETVHVNYTITATKDKASGKNISQRKPELIILPRR